MLNVKREKIAELEHRQWSGWIVYMFGECELNDDGSMTIPKELVDRWRRLSETHYRSLTEKERESDRIEADRTIRAIKDKSFNDDEIVY